jgi:hypothetical protein
VLGASVEPFALSALKYGLLALLFLFIWRAMRWVIRGLNVEPASPALVRTGDVGATIPLGGTLVVFPADGGKPRSVRIDANVTIGRAPECELRIDDDTYVSQQHARVFGKGGSWYVEDLGSTNGTYVNEQRLAAPAMVSGGDRIRVGTTVLELRR